MVKELLDSLKAIKNPGEAREQIFAVEPMDMVVPRLSGLSRP